MRIQIDDHWFIARLSEIRNQFPLVTEAISVRLQELLKGQLSERQLTQLELRNIAKTFIKDMAPASPKAEAKK